MFDLGDFLLGALAMLARLAIVAAGVLAAVLTGGFRRLRRTGRPPLPRRTGRHATASSRGTPALRTDLEDDPEWPPAVREEQSLAGRC